MTSRRLLAAAVSVALLAPTAHPALADSRKLLVLQSEGRVDAATRAKIDAAILRLAVAAEPQAAPGDLNFTDAATAVGCKPDDPPCKDEVLAMLAVDEIVITTVAPRPGGIAITVRRTVLGSASREATMLLATGTPPDTLDGIAPLFASIAAPRADPAPASDPRGDAAATPAEVTQPPAPSAAAPPPEQVTLTDPPSPQRRRLELVGMAGGAGLVVLGLACWGVAGGVQRDIDEAPTTTAEDLARLRDLESRGDAYAGLGNLFTVGGLVVGGVAAYLYLKDRRAASTSSARLAPVLLDRGAGVVLTIGATP
jgi:hypothetical protein